MGKDSNFISEIGKFFTDSKADKAMHAIMDMAARIRFDEKRLFGTESRYNCKYTSLQVFSHVKLGMILGFKALFLGLTDGKTQLILDMAVVGDEGKSKKHGLTKDQLEGRFTKDREEGCPAKVREEEYTRSKIALMMEMIRRAIHGGVRFDYILADSWFASSEVIHFVKSRHIRCHYLGMIKVGKKGVMKYLFEGKNLTAPGIVAELLRQRRQKYSRRLRCHYMTADVVYDGVKVRLFFVKRVKNNSWNGLLTTDTSLEFMAAYRIYSMRWSIEVVFKDCKGLLGLGKYNVRNFTSQIACTTITAIQYNILSVSRRFSDYETIGGLFRDCVDDSLELSVTERLWQALLDLVAEIAEIFGIDDDNVFDILVNKSDQLNHFVNFYKLKQAC